jgi:hypothetical protein
LTVIKSAQKEDSCKALSGYLNDLMGFLYLGVLLQFRPVARWTSC